MIEALCKRWTRLRTPLVLVPAAMLLSCVRLPENLQPVSGFDVERYLGRWYEVARLDHSFERGLTNVTAEYSVRDDGGLKVVNRGYNEQEREWSEAEGRAYFVESRSIGYLKVSFFGPFYSPYVVFELDEADYSYAFVAGKGQKYLWLLAREPKVSEAVEQKFLRRAGELGFPVEQLIWVDHSRAQ